MNAQTALTDEQIAMLCGLLISIRPKFGAPGSRDVDVARQQKRIDAALSILAVKQPIETKRHADLHDVREWVIEHRPAMTLRREPVDRYMHVLALLDAAIAKDSGATA